MDWPTRLYTNNQVKAAGKILRDENVSPESEEWNTAYDILANFRICHTYPMNTFKPTLARYAHSVDSDAIIAQRLKRTPTIIDKLKREPGIQLSTMQDIGGLRAIVNTIQQLERLKDRYENLRVLHERNRIDDYIQTPKVSGYRGIHFIFKYENQKVPEYNGLKLEIQLRTKLQHIWATAVETLGTYLDMQLKLGRGQSDWKEFFAIASTAFAHFENTNLVPSYEHLSRRETFQLLTEKANELGVREKLKGFAIASKAVSVSKGRADAYHLVVLDLKDFNVTVTKFSKLQIEEAQAAYSAAEQEIQHQDLRKDVVLVNAGDIGKLKKAYPNYFLDAATFLNQLKKIEIEAKSSRSKK